MGVSDAKRQHLHKMLDELLDEDDAANSMGVLFIQEFMTGEPQQHALMMRGLVPRGSLRLRELLHQLKNQ